MTGNLLFNDTFFALSCGSGLSGEVLTEQGHYWVGLDISTSMLGIVFYIIKISKSLSVILHMGLYAVFELLKLTN